MVLDDDEEKNIQLLQNHLSRLPQAGSAGEENEVRLSMGTVISRL